MSLIKANLTDEEGDTILSLVVERDEAYDPGGWFRTDDGGIYVIAEVRTGTPPIDLELDGIWIDGPHPITGAVSDLESHLLDDDAWERRSRHWRALVDEILASIPDADAWPPTKRNFHADGGTPLPRDSQSICEGRSWRADRAFSIKEQRPGLAPEPFFGGWVNDHVAAMTQFEDIRDLGEATRWFDETPPEERPARSELVLHVEESDRVDTAVRALLAVWLRPATTVEEMDRVLDQALRRRTPPR